VLSPITSDPLNIRDSFQRGWQAFARSPWVFIGFTLVGGSACWVRACRMPAANG
jgi:hypothetical protein